MGVLESREALQTAVDTGRAESDESYGERQLANFRTLLAIPEFDEMTVEQRRKCYEDLARGFQPTVPRSGLPGDPFPVIGWLLLAAGVAISISSFFLDTSTVTTADGTSLGDIYVPGSTTVKAINIGLLQTQLMVFQAGVAVAIAGVILLAAAILRAAMIRTGTAK